MIKRARRKRVETSAATKYHAVARAFLVSARALADLGSHGDTYGNAIAVVAIHAAIAFTDALTIAYGALKSTEDDHGRAAEALQTVLGSRVTSETLGLLRTILLQKDTVSYQGNYYPLEDGQELLAKVARYCAWAEDMYRRRPVADARA